MNCPTRLLASALFLTLGCSLVFGGTVDLSTGLDGSGNLLSSDPGCDANWTRTAGPATACSGSHAQIVTPSDADWYSGWLANGSGSNWITSSAGTSANGSPLPSYQVQFYLNDTTGASFTGSWSIDDSGFILSR